MVKKTILLFSILLLSFSTLSYAQKLSKAELLNSPENRKLVNDPEFINIIKLQCTEGVAEGLRDGAKPGNYKLKRKFIKHFSHSVCDCAIPKMKDKFFEPSNAVVAKLMTKTLDDCAQEVLKKVEVHWEKAYDRRQARKNK